jgi:hypothetical protein
MSEDASTEDPGTPPPPAAGELLPRAAEAYGVRRKLATYALDITHKDGGPKAQGFKLTAAYIDN